MKEYIFNKRSILLGLIKNDLKQKMAGSCLGKVWLFLNPLITILMMWIVFSIGFKNPPIEKVPFIIWISCGMIVWIFFSDVLISVTNSLNEYSFLLKQMQFKPEVILILKIFSSTSIYLFLNIILFLISLIYNFELNFYLIQLIYYYLCIFYLVLGLGYLFSSLKVFIKDIYNLVIIILQFGFWYTPIFWNLNLVQEKYRWIFKLNPIYYIIQGYRNMYIYKKWFWEYPQDTFIFFIITTFIFFIGKNIFEKLKYQFNDVI